jgi:hypothetical protein
MEEDKRKEMAKEQLAMGCIAQQNKFRECWDMGWHEIIACRMVKPIL